MPMLIFYLMLMVLFICNVLMHRLFILMTLIVFVVHIIHISDES